MKKKMQKFTSLLLTLLMILSVLPSSVLAADRNVNTNQVHVIVENTTFTVEEGAEKQPAWEGTIVDTWVEISNGSTMMSAITAALDEEEITYEGADQGYINNIGGLKEKDGNSGSGWMGTLNDWFVNQGFNNFAVQDGDEIRVMYTNGTYDSESLSGSAGEDLGSFFRSNDTSLSGIAFSTGTLDKAFDAATTEYTLTLPQGTESLTVTPTAANKNFQVHTYVGETEYGRSASIPVSNETVITVKCGDPSWPTMNISTNESPITATTYTFTVKVEQPVLTLGSLSVWGTDGSTKDENVHYEMTPAFESTKYDGYTVSVADFERSVYVEAALAEGIDRTNFWILYSNSFGGFSSSGYSSVPVTRGNFRVCIKGIGDYSTQKPEYYTVNVSKFATLKSLSVNGQMSPDFKGSVRTYSALVEEGASGVEISAAPYSDAYTVTVGGQPLVDGKATISCDWDENNKAAVQIVVSGEGVESGVYTLNLERAPMEDTPYFNAQPTEGVDYIVTDTVKPLEVWATANGSLSYQWYYNETESTEGGTLIEGATADSYTPPSDTDYVRWYYCIATNTNDNGTYTSTSTPVRIKMDKDPTPTVELLTTGEALPTDDGYSYPSETGYAYDFGQTEDIEPLQIEYSSEVEGGTWSFQWYVAYSSGGAGGQKVTNATEESYAVDTSTYQKVYSYASSNGNVTERFYCYYYCRATYNYNGRSYSAQTKPVCVYVRADKAPEDTISADYQPKSAVYIAGTTPTAFRTWGRGNYGTRYIQWYSNTENSYEGATPYGESYMSTSTLKSIPIPGMDEPGHTYWFYTVSYKYQKFDGIIYSDIADLEFIDCTDYIQNTLGYETLWEGEGTEDEPWLISSQEDLNLMSEIVAKGVTFSGKHFQFTQDIALDENYVPLGAGTTSGNGKNLLPFSGTIDGDGHTLTYPSGTENVLIKYAREATVKNLNIYGEYIANFALVSNYYVDYGTDGNYNTGCPETIAIDNVTIKSGTTIKNGGLIGGFASGVNIIRITNCTVEKGVIVGYDQTAGAASGLAKVGSLAGEFNGYIDNCTSYATVYGTNYVGGIVGAKGQSMGPYEITNCYFGGEVIATGNYAGGIAGSGYNSASAPNTPCATIKNCESTGEITGANYVGGIFGGEPACKQCWDNGIGYIQGNTFRGHVSATTENAYVGGIIGFMKSLDRYNIIENNYWATNCGAESGIGSIEAIDYTTEKYSRSEEFVVDQACIPTGAIVKAEFEKDYYKSGDTVTMRVYLYGAEDINALGYSIQYDGSKMIFVSAEAAQGFEVSRSDVDKNNGALLRTVYVPEGNKTTAEENGLLFDTVRFMMLEDGIPTVTFKTVDDDNDFADRKVNVMKDGSYIEAFDEVGYKESVIEDMAAAAEVDRLIEAIGEVNLESKEAVNEASDAYNALTEAQKEYVEKLAVLKAAQAKLDLWEKGDVNLDGKVNLADLSLMLSVYATENAACDITMDGVVNSNDFSILLANYGARI